jgi:membrane-associated protease RseP (regulator of RpoE activity)
VTSSSFPPPVVPDEEWLRPSLPHDGRSALPWPPEPKPSAWKAWGRNVLLFVLTSASVYLSGGPLLVGSLMSILLAHEMGHYLACRYYRVDATLPFFIPFPLLSLVGTLGAFIRIKSPFPGRKALFDIGIAGPLAGFAVCVPVLALSLQEMTVARLDPSSGGLLLGDPLLLTALTRLAIGHVPDGSTVVIGPLGLAAWFGLFMTALNLMPIGQLDGGHVVYALFGRRAEIVSKVGWWVCVGLIYFSPSWVVWAILIRVLGRRHPPTMNDYEPVGRGRVVVALLGLAIFVVSFVPSPVVGSWETILELIGVLPRS